MNPIKMRKTNRIIKGILIIIFLSFTVSLILISFTFNPLGTIKNDKHINISGGTERIHLHYRDIWEFSYTVSIHYAIEWSFSSNNDKIGILALAMDNLNYQNYMMNKTDIFYYVLSNGQKSNDRGCFAIPYEDQWFIILINENPDQNPIIVDFDWDITENPVLFIYIPIIISISVVLLCLVLYLILRKKGKKIQDLRVFILGIILLLSVIYLTYRYAISDFKTLEKYPSYPISSSSPIHIYSNNDISRYNIPGSGTMEDPYRIENRTICSGEAIRISWVSGYFIIKNNLLLSAFPIYLYNIDSGCIKIFNNTCIGTLYNTRGFGMYISSIQSNLNISYNKLINYDLALHLGHSPHSYIQNNKFLHNNLNLYLYSSNSTQILNNTFIFKEGDSLSKDCIYITSSYNCSVKNNILEGSGLDFSNYLGHSLICENNLVNNKELGFYTDLDGVVIDNSDTYGQLFLINCSDIVIKNQNIENTNYALTFINCSICSCDYSNFSNNHNIGIRIIDSNEYNVSNCRFSFNSEGAYISNSNSTTFLDNTFNNNIIGIHIYYSECAYLNNVYYNNTENWRIDQDE